MKTLELGKYRRARVWLGELPDAVYSASPSFAKFGEVDRGEAKIAAVELLIPTGGRTIYGLLGGQFKPAAGYGMSIEIAASTQSQRAFSAALTGPADRAYVGLPAEYTDAVNAGIKLAKEPLSKLGNGTLSINCAAHSLSGSSSLIFRHLALILIKLMGVAGTSPTDGDLQKLFPDVYN
jgi:hypothetical protein